MTEQVAKERVARPRAAAKTPEQIALDQVEADEQAAMAAATMKAIEAHGDLVSAIVWVTGKITKVAKNGTNNHFGYSYATKDDVINELKPLMMEAGLSIIPHHVSSERSEPDAKGFVDLVAKWNMQIIHRTGGSLVVPWESESMDNGDKNIGKAATSAKKMFFRALFDIPDGEPDLEHDANASAPRAAGQRAATSTRPSGSASVSTKTILDYKETHGLNWNQLSQAIEAAGGDGSAKVKDVPADLRPTILANLERIVAGGEVAAQEAQTAPDVQSGYDDDGPAASCTCGAGNSAPPEKHDNSCDMSIPF